MTSASGMFSFFQGLSSRTYATAFYSTRQKPTNNPPTHLPTHPSTPLHTGEITKGTARAGATSPAAVLYRVGAAPGWAGVFRKGGLPEGEGMLHFSSVRVSLFFCHHPCRSLSRSYSGSRCCCWWCCYASAVSPSPQFEGGGRWSMIFVTDGRAFRRSRRKRVYCMFRGKKKGRVEVLVQGNAIYDHSVQDHEYPPAPPLPRSPLPPPRLHAVRRLSCCHDVFVTCVTTERPRKHAAVCPAQDRGLGFAFHNAVAP